MPRLHVIEPSQATEPIKQIYDELTAKMGKVLNIFQGMANSPAALRAYLAMSSALAKGELSLQDREAVYLAVSEYNGCHYCVSAHSVVAKRTGLSDDDVLEAREFRSPDDQRGALLNFVRRVIATKGYVSDDELAAIRSAGYSDGQIAEAIAYIGLATYSNYFNHVHHTQLDVPAAPVRERSEVQRTTVGSR